MSQGGSSLAALHLIGDRSGLDSAQPGGLGLRPALFGNYRDLSSLRYDFPLVLAPGSDEGVWAKSLADIVDGILQKIAAPGPAGETTRRQILSLEQTIRTLLAQGHKGLLSSLWEEAASRQVTDAEGDARALLEATLQRARDEMDLNGEIIDCDGKMAAKLLTRAWQQSERTKAQRLFRRIDRLAQKLSDILQVDYQHSPGARAARHLESSMGAANQSVFDFEEMARVLRSAPAANALPKNRKKRIQSAISVLESQRFVAAPSEPSQGSRDVFPFDFDDCRLALASYRERLPEMAALIRAISIARLEIENRYDESAHDEFFNAFDEDSLGPSDLEEFPSYLLCLENADEAEQTTILNLLRAGLPFKILAQTADILGQDSMAEGRLSFGTRGQQLAHMAMGIEQVFVLQAASASLYRVREFILEGMANDRAALFSVFSGVQATSTSNAGEPLCENAAGLPPYLVAAAATESRAFPCFTYNPAAGPGLASRFQLNGNPESHRDWTEHGLSYEDAEQKSQCDQQDFTLLDFIATDTRYAMRFVTVPRADWIPEMVPAGEYLKLNSKQRVSRVPYLLLVDQDSCLHRAVFDERLVDAARRCQDSWHKLQELAGINNSHTIAALTLAQEAWNEEKERRKEEQGASIASPSNQPAGAEPKPTAGAGEKEPAAPVLEETAPDDSDPWIETIRCTTCNECTQLNDRLFAYDADQRAHIADPDAGTYRELVEAAESCQVAIIHPGEPRNPDEPGLEELIERAQPFRS